MHEAGASEMSEISRVLGTAGSHLGKNFSEGETLLSGTRLNPVEEEKRTKEEEVVCTRHGSGVNRFRPEHDGLVAVA